MGGKGVVWAMEDFGAAQIRRSASGWAGKGVCVGGSFVLVPSPFPYQQTGKWLLPGEGKGAKDCKSGWETVIEC